ncbi:MAG: anti-sigma factor [Armatimonadia bacterium]
MACPSGQRLSAYLDGTLPARQRERLERHLQTCLNCRRELAQLQRLQALLHDSPTAYVPPDLVALTMDQARRRVNLPVRQRVPAPVWAAACAVVAVLAFSISLQMRQPGQSGPVEVTDVARSLAPASALPVMAALPAMSREARSLPPVMEHEPVFFSPARPALRVASRPVAATPVRLRGKTVASDRIAARALFAARRHADDGDPDLTIAALENVAQAYPRSPEAAEALLTAADIERSRGNVSEADVVYRRVLSLPAQEALPQALAHKGLADLRRAGSGDDEVVRFHYAQARRALRQESAQAGSPVKTRALVVLADIEKTTGRRDEAVADYATAVNAAPAAADVETALAEVL